jgi:murein DD-endopeptidase MepM/ murein hydrolase activator NlpD
MPDGYGLYVVLRRDSELSTLYAHLSLVRVASGDLVTAGDVVGEVGSTGKSTGSHLHFEVQVAGHPVDPLPMLPVGTGSGGDARPYP